MSGEIVSDGDEGQLVRGDGKGLGQLWAYNPDPAPEWREDMAFGGMRNIELHVRPDGSMTGRISDPAISAIRGSPTPYIELKLVQDGRALF
jgi:hypothetical protein